MPTPDGAEPVRRWVLQDANYNVVGAARECDNSLIRQFRYQPYGDFERDGPGHVTGIEEVYEDGTPVAVMDTSATTVANLRDAVPATNGPAINEPRHGPWHALRVATTVPCAVSPCYR